MLTYDDSNVPTHYGFKSRSNVQKLESQYHILAKGVQQKAIKADLQNLRLDAKRILSELDSESRWITNKRGVPAITTAQSNPDDFFLESAVFSKNLTRLAEFVAAAKKTDKGQ